MFHGRPRQNATPCINYISYEMQYFISQEAGAGKQRALSHMFCIVAYRYFATVLLLEGSCCAMATRQWAPTLKSHLNHACNR